MYRLIRVKDSFQVVEGRKSDAVAPPVAHAHHLSYYETSSRYWSSCSHVEKQSWKKFLKTGSVGPKEVRSTILESWERCRNSHAEFNSRCVDLISGKDLENRRGLLWEISEPIMETLHQCVRGSGYLIVLAGSDGRVLESLGDLASLKQAEKLFFGPGANWSEMSVGTNAIGTALTLGIPMQVTGVEHYCETHQVWTCSATPIRGPEGDIIGCLDISGPREMAHFHTLGMTVAAVRAIEERLRLEQSHEYYMDVSKNLSTVLNSVTEGLITIDNRGLITGINVAAAKLLSTQSADLLGKPVEEIVRIDGRLRAFVESGREFAEEELLLKSEKGLVRCIGSANRIIGEDHSGRGAVLTFTQARSPASSLPAGEVIESRFMFTDIIGESLIMQETLEKVKRFAKGPSTILIMGESGTGKELFAQAIHNASARKSGPFVSVNCGAIPGELIQSELFGYVEGAFTGAKKAGRPGKLEQASGGTIFLDEISEMPFHMQVNLLRVLEEMSIVRIGDNRAVPVDVRVVAATNKSLFDEVTAGRFRQDLFYRLSVISLILPPLRERTGDITLLAGWFVEKASRKVGKQVRKIAPSVFDILEAHSWPGNVRELSNTMEYAVNMLQGDELTASHLPNYLKKRQKPPSRAGSPEILPLHEMEKQAILNAMLHFEGNITKMAGALGIGRNTLYCKMKKYGIVAGS